MKKQLFTLAFATLIAAIAYTQNCGAPPTGLVPISDLGTGMFNGWMGGLYPNGANAMPAAHKTAGMQMVSQVQCLNASGNPDPINGKVVWLSIGMSNTTQETQQFIPLANAFPGKNPKLTLVDGAVGAMPASTISTPGSPNYTSYWNTVNTRLSNAGVSANQVQVIWFKEANPVGNTPVQEYYDSLVVQMKRIMNELKTRFPTIKLCYFSSRISARYATSTLNPEPHAYWTGWAMKKVIADQIAGDPQLQFSGPNAKSPWLAWSVYLWSDGSTPQASNPNVFWTCPTDFNTSDGTHPSTVGAQKVASLLLQFFSTDATATPWFTGASCSAPTPPFWQPTNGSQGGIFRDITCNQTTGKTYLITHWNRLKGNGLSGNMYISADNEASWSEIDNGLNNQPIYGIAHSSVNGNLVASVMNVDNPLTPSIPNKIYFSNNNGSNWTLNNSVYFAGNLPPVAMLFNSIADTIFAGQKTNGISFSANNGSSWQTMNMGLSNPNITDLEYGYQGKLYACTDSVAGNGGKVFVKNGSSWTNVSMGLPNTRINDLHYDSGTATMYLGTAHFQSGSGKLYKSVNGGAWTLLAGYPGPEVSEISTTSGGDPIVRVFKQGVWRYQAGAWKAVNTNLNTLKTSSLTRDKAGNMLVTTGAGIWKFDDMANTWHYFTNGISNSQGRSLAFSQAGDMIVGTDNGMYKSPDGGNTWTHAGLTDTVMMSTILYTPDGRMFAGDTDNSASNVFTSTDNGSTWKRNANGIVSTRSSDFAYNSQGKLFVGTGWSKPVHATTDGMNWTGAQWSAAGFSASTVTIAIAINAANTIFVGTESQGVLRSTNNGLTYAHVALSGGDVTDIQISPEQNVYVTHDAFSGNGNGGFYRSSDGGNTWSGNLMPVHGLTNCIYIASNDSIYVGTTQGVWLSTNKGNTWVLVNHGLNAGNLVMHTLELGHDGYLYAGTAGAGIYRSVNKIKNVVVAQVSISTSANPLSGGYTSGDGSFLPGAQVNLNATPNSGWAFVSWTENGMVVSTDPLYGFTAMGSTTLVANFDQLSYMVSTSSNPSSGGTTSGGGAYLSGTQITVGATPNSGWTFVNWTENGVVVSTDPLYGFTAMGNATLVANFDQLSYMVSTSSNPPSGGTTSGGGAYLSGTQITVGATPNSGWTFVNWTENGIVVSTDPLYGFTAMGNTTLVANFDQLSYMVSTSSNPPSGGTTSGGGAYLSGTQITVGATPNSGWTFVSWTENGIVVSTDPLYGFIAMGNTTLVANFDQQSYMVSTSSNPPSGGTTSGGGAYLSGTQTTVGATPNSGWTFVNWTENGVVVSTDPLYGFTAMGNATLVANFDQLSYMVSTSSNPPSGGTTSGGGAYLSDTQTTVGATSNSGWTFVNWTENAAIVSNNPSYSFAVDGNKNLVAAFSFNSSVEALSLEKSIQIIPNPSAGNFSILTMEGLQVREIEICDLSGKKVRAFNLSGPPYFIQAIDLPKGAYLVNIRTVDNHLIVKKISIF